MKTIDERINNLANNLDENDQNRAVVIDIILNLRKSHEDACNRELSKQELYDLIFSKNNCLAIEGADNLSEDILQDIKNIQEEIVDTYGLQD
jgi:hypothetical protein